MPTPAEERTAPDNSILEGVRVIEFTDVTAEYVGLELAGLGAEVIKIEPGSGALSRAIGPFVGDTPDPERSLHFWHYNRGKKSVVIDVTTDQGRAELLRLIGTADIFLQSVSPDHPDPIGLSQLEIRDRFPSLVHARMTPFGDDGPWSRFAGSDLVHLALGGVAMCCGYDPAPAAGYDLPPIAPQLWHAYHVAGEQLLYGVQVALYHRARSGEGQTVNCAIHEAVAKNTEIDVMEWAMRRVEIHRQTCRHASANPDFAKTIAQTKDGRWIMAFSMMEKDADRTMALASSYGISVPGFDPGDGTAATGNGRNIPGSAPISPKMLEAQHAAKRLIESFTYDAVPWREAQTAGLMWVPLRKPHENATDEHWLARGTFDQVEHEDLGESYLYPVSKWRSSETTWKTGTRAPHIGEHTTAVTEDQAPARTTPVRGAPGSNAPATTSPRVLESPHGKPFPLSNVRILDFGWFLASAGGTRILSGFGAETIKVEWHAHPDTRLGAMAPVGGRAARQKASGPLPPVTDPDMGGQFNNKNPGKLGLSLNVTHPQGLEIARELVRVSDVVTEGFSPGVLDKWGLGYPDLRKLNDQIIYVQQSGMGSQGTYGRFRTVGPVAGSFSGLSEMSGLEAPFAPAGWGYSYLDWIGAYGFAQAILAGLYYREMTGRGQHIDSSQVESGIALVGPSLLDWQVNGREFVRSGNRSPYSNASPHGIYPSLGTNRWIAIAVFTDTEWQQLARTAGHEEWANNPRFATVDARDTHRSDVDRIVSQWTARWDSHELMDLLQAAGVRAGAAQTAADRYERDPQLAHLEWLTEVDGTKIGRWPVYELPVYLSATPPHSGGRTQRGAPNYGEDNEYVLGDVLGMSTAEIGRLRSDGVI
ncbi:MAG: CoA transferase [Candidatus Saccharibacteria bacterium]|nr:CoA transferase [Microbacteriaceae bacterium]